MFTSFRTHVRNLSFVFLFPTLQNLRQENRVFKRENLSAVHLKDFSLNIKIFSKLCSRMIFASFHQGKEGLKNSLFSFFAFS